MNGLVHFGIINSEVYTRY